MGCEYKGCLNPAANGGFCKFHLPANTLGVEQDSVIISIADVPATRTNEAAVGLLRALNQLGADKALKVRLRKFSKASLQCTQRYALATGLRIGLRFVGEWAYLWKMTPEQIAAAQKRGERIAMARQKKKLKGRAA